MARTLHGNLTGRAAVTEHREQFNKRIEAAYHEDVEREAINRFRLADAMDALRAADPNWEAWYDSDAVPDWSNDRSGWQNIDPVLKIINDHIQELSILKSYAGSPVSS